MQMAEQGIESRPGITAEGHGFALFALVPMFLHIHPLHSKSLSVSVSQEKRYEVYKLFLKQTAHLNSLFFSQNIIKKTQTEPCNPCIYRA